MPDDKPAALPQRLLDLREKASAGCAAYDRDWKARLIAAVRAGLPEDLHAAIDPRSFVGMAPCPHDFNLSLMFAGHRPLICHWQRTLDGWQQTTFTVDDDKKPICCDQGADPDAQPWWMVDLPRSFIGCLDLGVALHYARLFAQPRT